MQNLGDYIDDYATLNFLFTILRDDTGAPIILAGSPVVSVFKGSNATPKTSAESYVTLDIDHNSVTGLNHVLIDLSGDAFFVAGEDYTVILSTGTVNGVSKVGVVLAHFSIDRLSVEARIDALVAAVITNAAGADVAADIIAVKAETAAIVTDTVEIGSAVGADLSADIAAIKTETALIVTDTNEIGPAGASLTDLGGMSTGMKAEVNVEAKDVLDTDTHAEPAQGAPGATISTGAKIDFLYKAWRNKTEQTATLMSIYNDAGAVVDHKSTVSDDSTTATREEVVTGP